MLDLGERGFLFLHTQKTKRKVEILDVGDVGLAKVRQKKDFEDKF